MHNLYQDVSILQEHFVLGLFLVLLVVAGVIALLRLLYAFVCSAPETGMSDSCLTIVLKNKAQEEQAGSYTHL